MKPKRTREEEAEYWDTHTIDEDDPYQVCMECGWGEDNITASDYIWDLNEGWIYCQDCDAWTCFEEVE